ncbi:hypothetical protein [Streptomyces sp. NPDC000410]|uniref:hypothetical protein n=1 Tax=Streptomyces sp. NPDC000410 TaxID=3154254 RepID=UPI0033180DDC
MSPHPCTRARAASYTALLLTASVLLSLLLPGATGPAYATTTTTPTAATAAEDCAVLPLAPFGDPGSAVGKVPLAGNGTACFTFTAEQPGMHRVLLKVQHHNTYVSVFDGETELDCYDDTWGEGWCPLPRAGDFTLRLLNNTVDPDEATVTVTPLATTANCGPETGTSWDAAPVTGSATGALAIQCQPFSGKPGERITVDARTTKYGIIESWITDGTGTRICPWRGEDGGEGCVLPGTGPYRVLTRVKEVEDGFPGAYTLAVRRLSEPEGCARVPVNGYNAAPTTVEPAANCKTFSAPAAGRYHVYAVHSGDRTPLRVYDRAGKTACESWNACELPGAGDYTVVTGLSTLIIDRASAAGCEPAALGVHQGALTAGGEIDCLTLPLPEGARMAALKPLTAAGPDVDVIVADATGTYVCHEPDLSAGTCQLTGTAPFRALVSTDNENEPTGPYALALHRTDVANSCQAVPAGDFTAGSASARIDTGNGTFSHCLSIPADDHTAVETLQLQVTEGSSTAAYSVVDVNGTRACGTDAAKNTWAVCNLTPGVAHTVLVTGHDIANGYTLTRRDVTQAAKGCVANPATAVGGPSTSGPTGAPGTAVCRQVTTADAKDTLHLNVRDALGSARMTVFDADGKVVCGSGSNKSCAVTGSARYQALVTVPAVWEAAPSYRFDALRIATAAGPAPECAKVPNISYGYGPLTGTLTEQHTADCAVLPTAYRDRLKVKVADTTAAAETAVPELYDASLGNGCSWWSPTKEWQCAVDEPYTTGATPSILVLGLPETTSQTAYRADIACAASLCGPERISVSSVAPTTGVSGTKVTVTATGTALRADDKIRLSSGDKDLEFPATSVSADRKTLTAVVDLTGIAPGGWYISVVTHNAQQWGAGSFTVTAPAALKNTAAPSFTGTPQVGATLTAAPGSWSQTPESYAYQWKANGVAIPGATAATYTVPAAVLGKSVSVTVTARRAGYADGSATSAAVVVAKGVAPKATTAPKLSGTVQVGARVGVSLGGWAPSPTSYTYQWKANGVAISGATASSYVVPATLLGKQLSVTVTALRTGHANGAATTAPVVIAKGVAPKATVLPVITGTAKVGRTLTAGRGTWTPTPASYGYQWYENGRAIVGATKSTLVLKTAQRGKKITVKVTAHRTGHLSGAATSRPTATVVS